MREGMSGCVLNDTPYQKKILKISDKNCLAINLKDSIQTTKVDAELLSLHAVQVHGASN